MATGRRITVHEAQIKTAAIEVKALVLNSRQITLSVFRQLKKETLVDPRTAQLRGVPWGTINYFWGKCEDNHLHVVWQCGDELRRDCVWPQAPRELVDEPRRVLDELGTVYVTWRTARGDDGYRAQGVRDQEKVERFVGGRDVRVMYQVHPRVQLANYGIDVSLAHDVECLYRGAFVAEGGRIRPFTPDDLARFQQHAARLAQDYAEQWADPEQVYEGMLAAEKEVEDRIKAWRKQYEALAALDQLFIAV